MTKTWRALFYSRNLIGDGLNIYPALKSWWNTHQDWEVNIYTLPDHTLPIYKHMGIPVNIITDDDQLTGAYDFVFNFDTNIAFRIGDKGKCHIVHAYATMLGVKILPEDFRLVFDPPEMELESREKGRVLISPFSRSCSSQSGENRPPNKMLPWKKWRPILELLKTMGPIGVLGGPNDRADELELPEDAYFTGLPLERVAHIIRKSKIVVTIDNGIAHLAAAQQVRMVLMYPACLGQHWIIPIGNNKNLFTIQLDPVTVDQVELTLAVKKKVFA